MRVTPILERRVVADAIDEADATSQIAKCFLISLRLLFFLVASDPVGALGRVSNLIDNNDDDVVLRFDQSGIHNAETIQYWIIHGARPSSGSPKLIDFADICALFNRS